MAYSAGVVSGASSAEYGGMKNEAQVARTHFDEIECHALQKWRTGFSDQDLDPIDNEMLVSLAFGIESHAVIHAAVIFLVSRDPQNQIKHVGLLLATRIWAAALSVILIMVIP